MTPTNALGAGRRHGDEEALPYSLDVWIALAVGVFVLAIAPESFTPILVGGYATICACVAVQTFTED